MSDHHYIQCRNAAAAQLEQWLDSDDEALKYVISLGMVVPEPPKDAQKPATHYNPPVFRFQAA